MPAARRRRTLQSSYKLHLLSLQPSRPQRIIPHGFVPKEQVVLAIQFITIFRDAVGVVTGSHPMAPIHRPATVARCAESFNFPPDTCFFFAQPPTSPVRDCDQESKSLARDKVTSPWWLSPEARSLRHQSGVLQARQVQIQRQVACAFFRARDADILRVRCRPRPVATDGIPYLSATPGAYDVVDD
jgi:hypothetical protein